MLGTVFISAAFSILITVHAASLELARDDDHESDTATTLSVSAPILSALFVGSLPFENYQLHTILSVNQHSSLLDNKSNNCPILFSREL
uniref:Putative secreted protein n=1 Tax=Amblyomma cajennense TaxID=34607 RepID=A0A023FBG9_AMBCJ